MITRAQLRAAGLSDSGISRLLRSGALQQLAPGVFLVRGAPLTYQARLWCAVLRTDGVLGFATGAHLWGVCDHAPPLIDVVLRHERRVVRAPGQRLHRVFVPASAVERRDGLPITSRRWTLLDHLGRLPQADAVRVADRSLQRGWLTMADVENRLQSYPGRTGNARLRKLAGVCSDGAAAESERVLHRLLRRRRVIGWLANHPIWADGELVAVVDVAFPDYRLAIEVDGLAHHTDTERFQRDRVRQNGLVSLGWTVLRFTWFDLTERPGYVVATIQRHLRSAA